MKHLRIKINKYEIEGNIILKDIDFILNEKDKISLVGGNGVGKTTLLKILTQEIKEFDGFIENIGNLNIGYLSQINTDDDKKTVREEIASGFSDIMKVKQELEILEEKLEKDKNNIDLIEKYSSLLEIFNNIGGYNYENQVHNVANGIGIVDLLDRKLVEISGGQRTKVALCKVLVEEPDILLLDEPTNFIDMKGVEWLESYLQNKWGNGYFIVSHDREFLDKTCKKTFELQPARQINFYHCNYSDYVLEREKIEDKKMEEYERQQEYIKKEENLINRFRAGSRASFAQSREKALDRLEKIEKPYIPQKPKFYFDYVNDESERILYFKECFIGRKDPLFFINELQLNKGNKIGIVGENGVGKSTFIKTIMGEIEHLDGMMLNGKGVKRVYYSQMHEELDKEKTIKENLLKFGIGLSDEQLIGLLRSYLIPKEVIEKKVKYLSGGQTSKLLFAILGQLESNFLILDEPTNHLDYDTREELEKSLEKYPGTILFISHDRYFVNKLAKNIWIIKDNELVVSYGNYEDYVYKSENGIDINLNLFEDSREMDLVLIEKVGEKEAKRLKEKFSRKRK